MTSLPYLQARALYWISRICNAEDPAEFASNPGLVRLRRWLDSQKSESTKLIYLGYVRHYLDSIGMSCPPLLTTLAIRYRRQKNRCPRLHEFQPLNPDVIRRALESPRYQQARSYFDALKTNKMQLLTMPQSLVLRDSLLVDIILHNAPR